MIIRPAVLKDLDAIVTLGQRFLAGSHYAGLLGDNPVQMRATAAFLMEHRDGLLLVADADGRLDGMIGMFVAPNIITGELAGTEMFWWVEPAARGILGVRLYQQAKQWATAKGCKLLQMIAPNEDVERFYLRLGYEKVETAYQIRIAS